jgi:hypothetical protein
MGLILQYSRALKMAFKDDNPDLTNRNCVFAFKCDANWDELSDTEDEDVKFCNTCQREVHFCETDEELLKAVKRNLCIAIDQPYGDGSYRFLGDVVA